MMKKLMIVITMFMLSIVVINQTVHAEAVLVPEPAVNTGGLWHVEDGNRVYVNMRYTEGDEVIETGSKTSTILGPDLSDYVVWNGSTERLRFPYTSLYDNYDIIANPDSSIYTRFVVEVVPEGEFASSINVPVIIYEGEANEISVFLHDFNLETRLYYQDWSYITLEIDGVEVLSNRNISQVTLDIWDITGVEANEYADWNRFAVKMYWEKTVESDEIDPNISTDPWSALPDTTGSPVNPLGTWGTVTNVFVNNQTVSFNVNYMGTIYPVSSFTVSGDLDFISKSNDILYYTDPNSDDRILYFNFGETLDSAILAARTFTDVEVWKGEALWNLTQSEIKVTDVLTVYNYIPDVGSDGNVYAYFYMPDVPIDDLISVSAILSYRYWDDGFLNIGPLEPGEIQYRSVQAVKGETSSINPTWVENAYTTAYIVGALAVVGTVSGVAAPIYGWPIAAACFITAGVLTAADINEWFAYDVEQIQHVIPSIALTNEINTYISSINGNDQFTADTDKLYKLHLATLNEGDEVEIMDQLSHVTQVVWETDGEIYVVNQDNIDDYWGGPGTEIPIDLPGNNDLEMLTYIGVGIGALFVFVKLVSTKNTGLLILIIAAALYILYELGML